MLNKKLPSPRELFIITPVKAFLNRRGLGISPFAPFGVLVAQPLGSLH